MSRNTIITIIVLVLVLGVAGYFLTRQKTTTDTYGYSTSDNQQGQIQNPMTNENQYWQKSNYTLPEQYRNKKATIQTNFGTVVVNFYDDHAPLAVENFIRLSQEGKYNTSTFHRIISGFMIQGGDYTRGNGTGGQSIYGEEFADELDPKTAPAGLYTRGTLAMANRGANTNGSQFFVMHADYPLPHSYTIFGKVVSGMETVDKIASLETDLNDAPTQKVIIEKVTIENR